MGAAPVMYETDPEAYALFLQGRHLNRLDTAAGYEQALALLQQALVLDPGYAAPWTELGIVYSRQANLELRPFDEGYTLKLINAKGMIVKMIEQKGAANIAINVSNTPRGVYRLLVQVSGSSFVRNAVVY